MKPGEQVKFKNPISEFEKISIYKITNINDETNRALITHVNGNLPIAPTELVSLNDIELL